MDKKILIVDDEASIRSLLEQTFEDLEDEGVELLIESNGADALETIKAKRPQLVFLDVMMPKMNGFDVCNAVKNELGFSDVYICMLTAKGQEFDRTKGMEVGADEYITKPFDPYDLYEKAEEILDV